MARSRTASSIRRTAATAGDVRLRGSGKALTNSPMRRLFYPKGIQRRLNLQIKLPRLPGARGTDPAPPGPSTSEDAATPAAFLDQQIPPAAEVSELRWAKEDVVVQITLVCGGLTNVRVPVVIGERYDGLPIAAIAGARNFPINLQKRLEAGKINTGNLLLASMGEPGRFAPDDLRFLMSNVTVAVKTMGHDQFATSLIGTRRHEMSIGDAARGFVEGILENSVRCRHDLQLSSHNLAENRLLRTSSGEFDAFAEPVRAKWLM
jgi:hypothetical protein